MDRVLLTGAAGFIGYHTAQNLLEAGVQVVGVDNLNDAYDVRLKQWRLGQLEGHEGFRFLAADVADLDSVQPAFEDVPDVVINLAARAGVRASVEDPWIYQHTNALGTLNLLELSRRNDVDRFVLASTSSLYGNHAGGAFKESDSTDRPLSPYAASKKSAEALVATYHHLYGIHAPTVRYFTVYGPAGRPDMSPFRFIRWVDRGEPITLFGDGEQRRDFTYVEDIARGTVLAAQADGAPVINLGGDHPVSMNEFIAEVESVVGKEAVVERKPAHIADMRATWADITQARTILGWEPTIGLREGLERTYTWYRQEKDLASSISLGPI